MKITQIKKWRCSSSFSCMRAERCCRISVEQSASVNIGLECISKVTNYRRRSNDRAFFGEKQWYGIDACLDRMMRELNAKWHIHTGDLAATVKAYNGNGPRADNYASNVFQFLHRIKVT